MAWCQRLHKAEGWHGVRDMSNQRDCARLEGQKLGENAFEWNQ